MVNYSIVDIELTEDKEIIEISIIKADEQLNITSKHDFLFKSSTPISKFMENLTGINQEMLEGKPYFKDIAEDIFNILSDDILICHGVNQDYSSLNEAFSLSGMVYEPKALIDTVELSKIFMPTLRSYKLSDICKSLGIVIEGQFHRANVDTQATYEMLKIIINSFNKLSENNYNYLLKLMSEYSPAYVNFIKLYRGEESIDKSSVFKAYGLDFAICNLKYSKNLDKKKIYLSAINEESYIDLYLKGTEVAILKDKYSYLVLNIFDIASKSNEKNQKLKNFLLMRLVTWIQSTQRGDFDELNLDASEKNLLLSLYENQASTMDNYYYNKNLEFASQEKSLVSNYSSVLSLLSEEKLRLHDIVVENKDILYQEIKRQYIKTYHYKHVLTEINKTLNKNYSKKLLLIKENIENLMVYFHEMYINESDSLYSDELSFIFQELDYIKELIETNNIRLLKTEKFINILKSILLDKDKGYYTFEHREIYSSMCLKFNDVKNQKRVVNQFFSRNISYLKKSLKNNIKEIKEWSRQNPEKNTLYLFEDNKIQELRFLERDKKSNLRFKQYNLDTPFSDIYDDLVKWNLSTRVCYANKEILAYSIYLTKIFDEILIFKDKKI